MNYVETNDNKNSVCYISDSLTCLFLLIWGLSGGLYHFGAGMPSPNLPGMAAMVATYRSRDLLIGNPSALISVIIQLRLAIITLINLISPLIQAGFKRYHPAGMHGQNCGNARRREAILDAEITFLRTYRY
jgi:hypothetical protein